MFMHMAGVCVCDVTMHCHCGGAEASPELSLSILLLSFQVLGGDYRHVLPSPALRKSNALFCFCNSLTLYFGLIWNSLYRPKWPWI